MAKSLTTLQDIVDAGLLAEESARAASGVASRYAIAVTPEMAELIDPADPADPIAAQFIPRPEELVTRPDETADPIGDLAHSPVRGIVHRYPDRVLFKVASFCPVYCRFCFRREMVGPDNGRPLSQADLDAAINYITDNPSIWEVIVTGGDPLALSPRRIGSITRALGKIDHVAVVRWHTRVPVVKPKLISAELIAALKACNRAVYVVLHANHPREFTGSAVTAIARLADSGICLRSQTVLLKGVNDDRDTLETLMRTFVANRISPYYLHHLDRAPGTSHFGVPLAQGQALIRSLRGHVSGLCQPTYVVDIPGGAGKVNATPCDVAAVSNDEHSGNTAPPNVDHYELRDRNGTGHRYECKSSEPFHGPEADEKGGS